MVDPTASPLTGRAVELSEELLRRVNELVDAARGAGAAALSAGVTLPGALKDSVGTVQHLIEQMPAPSAQVELLLQEVRAKRALVTAMQAQLVAFDAELDLLEGALRPLQEWSRQWERAQSALLDLSRALTHYPREHGHEPQ